MSINPFKKKATREAKNANQTLQDIQAQFNQVLFRIGDVTVKKNLMKQELSNLENQLQELLNETKKLGIEHNKIKQRIQEEVAAKAKKGATNEAPVAGS